MDDDGTIPPVSLVNPLDTARFLSNSSHAGRGLSELPLFLESIDHWYEVDPEKRALVWLDSKGEETDSYTRGELHREIDRIAGMLLASGVQPGDRAILFYPPSLDFVISLMACFRARIIGVPVKKVSSLFLLHPRAAVEFEFKQSWTAQQHQQHKQRQPAQCCAHTPRGCRYAR